jgi:hypothetical protein
MKIRFGMPKKESHDTVIHRAWTGRPFEPGLERTDSSDGSNLMHDLIVGRVTNQQHLDLPTPYCRNPFQTPHLRNSQDYFARPKRPDGTPVQNPLSKPSVFDPLDEPVDPIPHTHRVGIHDKMPGIRDHRQFHPFFLFEPRQVG